MKDENCLLVHYNQLPNDLFISLKPEFHDQFCSIIQRKINYKFKNCFHKILNCPKWHAQRLFTRFNRFTLGELEILREFSEISKEEVEANIETIGNHEDGTIIKNLKLPFNMKDIFYVASHLMFDGSYRDKKGCYFYSYEKTLTDYHKKRLGEFGDVPINFIEGENQLYFSYTIGYIAVKTLEIETFKSTKCYLSEKMKILAKENKILTDEIVKALIIDEGGVEDKIEAELANERLVRDLSNVFGNFYSLTKITSRTRTIDFKNKPEWTHTTIAWKIGFSSTSFEELYKSIFPLPIDYKSRSLNLLHKLKNRNYNQRKTNETRKLIVSSLLESPKSIGELSEILLVKQTTIRSHLRGHPTYRESLINLGIIEKVNEKLLRRGGYAKVGIYGIKDINRANEFLNN